MTPEAASSRLLNAPTAARISGRARRYVAGLVGSGDGMGNSAIPLHIGVGPAKKVDLRVKFPTGHAVIVKGAAVNQAISVKHE